MARPRIPIDWTEFDKLCALQCTLTEIAAWFNCTEDTIENACKRDRKQRFSDYHKTKAANGKMSLRRLQWKSAQDGNVAMQIWLGKQMLGQTDQTTINASVTQKGPDLATLSDSELEAAEALASKAASVEGRN